MGLFDIFKKKVRNKQELYTREMAQEVISNMKDTEQTVIRIDVLDDEVSLIDSKFGGFPYLPYDEEILKGEDRNNLQILAQINLEQFTKTIISYFKRNIIVLDCT